MNETKRNGVSPASLSGTDVGCVFIWEGPVSGRTPCCYLPSPAAFTGADSQSVTKLKIHTKKKKKKDGGTEMLGNFPPPLSSSVLIQRQITQHILQGIILFS